MRDGAVSSIDGALGDGWGPKAPVRGCGGRWGRFAVLVPAVLLLAWAAGTSTAGTEDGSAGPERTRFGAKADSAARGDSVSGAEPAPVETEFDRLRRQAAELRELIAQDSTSYDLHFRIANVYYDMGSLQMAALHYRKAAEIDPQSVKALVNLGAVLNEMGLSEEALEAFDKALKIDPKDLKALCNKGLAHYGLKQYAQAMEQYRKALAIDPKCVEAHYNLGVAFADVEMYREAIVEWNKVREIAPDSEAAKAAKANIEVVQKLIKLD